ncbi:MAG: MerR family DNA-binding transcriptional regulator [Acidobacteria bacterium]|nr:MerR family DNA-binding transcriptional regulator [Acidobacteriota bacterium]
MFAIGEFSRLARVTVKTLRHYDEAGLFKPAHVDRDSGYFTRLRNSRVSIASSSSKNSAFRSIRLHL